MFLSGPSSPADRARRFFSGMDGVEGETSAPRRDAKRKASQEVQVCSFLSGKCLLGGRALTELNSACWNWHPLWITEWQKFNYYRNKEIPSWREYFSYLYFRKVSIISPFQIDNSQQVLVKIARLYADRLMNDICLVVGGKEYPAHRLILCASSDVFEVSYLWYIIHYAERFELNFIQFRSILKSESTGKLLFGTFSWVPLLYETFP